VTYLDTHIVVWLRQGEDGPFSKRARQAMDADDELLISPMVMLELQTMHEIGRLKPSVDQVLEEVGGEVGLRVCSFPFGLVMDQALKEKWTCDPFDRIIVAHAAARRATLITRDQKILRHYPRAVW
jgi:PIN domain nuclease of toxin-antitoxin system